MSYKLSDNLTALSNEIDKKFMDTDNDTFNYIQNKIYTSDFNYNNNYKYLLDNINEYIKYLNYNNIRIFIKESIKILTDIQIDPNSNIEIIKELFIKLQKFVDFLMRIHRYKYTQEILDIRRNFYVRNKNIFDKVDQSILNIAIGQYNINFNQIPGKDDYDKLNYLETLRFSLKDNSGNILNRIGDQLNRANPEQMKQYLKEQFPNENFDNLNIEQLQNKFRENYKFPETQMIEATPTIPQPYTSDIFKSQQDEDTFNKNAPEWINTLSKTFGGRRKKSVRVN